METLEKRLEALYIQKNKIEEEIEFLKDEIKKQKELTALENRVLNKDEKIELFKSLNNIISKDIKSKGEYQLTDALEDMIKNKNLMTTYNVDGWLDCGKPETLLETNSYLLSKKNKNYKIPGSIIKAPVFIGKNTEIEECIIGSNVTIGDNCYIKNCIIKNSIIDSNNTIENVMLKDTIMGKNCKVIQKKMAYNLGEYSEKIQQ